LARRLRWFGAKGEKVEATLVIGVAALAVASALLGAGDAQGESTLKMIITESQIPIERKHHDVVMGKNGMVAAEHLHGRDVAGNYPLVDWPGLVLQPPARCKFPKQGDEPLEGPSFPKSERQAQEWHTVFMIGLDQFVAMAAKAERASVGSA
jgi:hypothetical protein